jgi:hypothetical protein
MYVCMCTCVCMCMCVCMYVCMCTYVCMCVCMFMCVCILFVTAVVFVENKIACTVLLSVVLNFLGNLPWKLGVIAVIVAGLTVTE